MVKVNFNGEVMKAIKTMVRSHKHNKIIVVLNYVKVTVQDENTFSVSYGNPDIQVEKIFSGVIEMFNKESMLIPIADLKKITSVKANNKYFFETNDEFKIFIGDNGISRTVSYFDPEEYPKLFVVKGVQKIAALNYEGFKKLQAASISCATSESRPVLTTIYVSDNTIVSTDSHRLYKTLFNGKIGEGDLKLPTDLIKMIGDLETGKHFFGLVHCTSNEEIYVETMTTRYLHRGVSGNYPQTDRLIYDEYKIQFNIQDVDKFKKVVEACYKLNKDDAKTSCMFLEIISENHIRLSANDSAGNKVEEVLVIQAKSVEEKFKIAFSSKFILDALKQINNEKVSFKIQGAMRPFLVEGTEKDTFSLILPVRTY